MFFKDSTEAPHDRLAQGDQVGKDAGPHLTSLSGKPIQDQWEPRKKALDDLAHLLRWLKLNGAAGKNEKIRPIDDKGLSAGQCDQTHYQKNFLRRPAHPWSHAAMGAFFTATSMIGFIAGAGIVVRNSIILVDFIEQRVAEGAPLDEAVIDIVLDLSGRPFVFWDVPIPECLPLGNPPFDPNLAEHAISSFATAANITLHVTLVRGSNVHHIVEAAFKGLGRSLRDAVRIEGGGVPSTKGVLA